MCDSTNAIGGRPLLVCKVCSQTENIRRCSRCQAAYYCSKLCQSQDWKDHRAECYRKTRELLNPPVPTATISSDPVPVYSNSLELQQLQQIPIDFMQDLQMPVQQEMINSINDSSLGGNNSNNNNFVSDSTLEIVGNIIQQQQPLPFFDNHIVNVNDVENGISQELRDFSMLDEIFFGSPIGDIDLSTTNIQLSSGNNDQNQFAIGGETMRLGNNDIFNPELNMQFR